MKEYVDLSEYRISFKNLLSGPAPVGRILNYIIFAGEDSIRHQPGSRSLKMENNIGSAWCIEFMIGLGLLELGDKLPNENVYRLKLTPNGRKMYNILIDNALGPNFDESSTPNEVLVQLEKHGALNIIHVLEKVFRESPVFINLCMFLNINETNEKILVLNGNEFKETFFGELKKFYEHEEYITNGNYTATTAGNRVPSLIQLCQFLKYIDVEKTEYYFNIDAFKNGIFDPSYKLDISDQHFVSELDKQEKIIERLSKEFGIAGTRIVVDEVRLSQVQLIFKERLAKEHGKKCFLCGIKQEELLIASHIKNASECDIYGKADNDNGLLLCAMHDKLFDRYLISFNFIDGKIMISSKISEEDKKLCNINETMQLDSKLMSDKRKDYLIWHNEEFYKKDAE